MQTIKDPTGDFGERPMKNINKVGVSDERQQKINELMSKLRARGQVGDSSEMTGAEAFLSKPKPAADPKAEEIKVTMPDLLEEVDTQNEESAEIEETAEQEEPEVIISSQQGPSIFEKAAAELAESDEVVKTTSGIGGAWSGKSAETAKKETHAPKVSTWGVFERPADISKAYGGGRQIGVGGYQPSEEEMARKRAETEAKLKAFRKNSGADRELQDAHEEEIQAALKEARQLMRFGATQSARDELERVQEWCCATTDLGSDTLLELAMVRIAAGDDEGAKPVLVQLQARAPKSATKRAAKQMLFQETAQEFLRVEKTNANEEMAKLGRMGLRSSLGVANDKRYDISGAYLSSTNRPPVSSISEARQVLRTAAVRRDDAGAAQRITQSLECLPTLPVTERFPRPARAMSRVGGSSSSGSSSSSAETAPSAEDVPSRVASSLSGEWLLGFTTSGRSISFAPSDASQKLSSSGAYERLAPGGPVGALVRTEGTFSVDESKPEPVLRFSVDVATLGPLPLPTLGRATEEQVLLLDALMCVTTTGGGKHSVWVRPSMAAVGKKSLDDYE